MVKLMGIYSCAQEQKCDLQPAEAAAKDLGLTEQVPSFLQVRSSGEAPEATCAPCVAQANELFGSKCDDPVCVVKAFAAKKDEVMKAQDGMVKLMGIYSCAQEQKCDLQPAEAAAKDLGLTDQAPSFLQMRSRDCPLCGAFDKCLNACATARHEALMQGRFCMERCGNAMPGDEIP